MLCPYLSLSRICTILRKYIIERKFRVIFCDKAVCFIHYVRFMEIRGTQDCHDILIFTSLYKHWCMTSYIYSHIHFTVWTLPWNLTNNVGLVLGWRERQGSAVFSSLLLSAAGPGQKSDQNCKGSVKEEEKKQRGFCQQTQVITACFGTSKLLYRLL